MSLLWVHAILFFFFFFWPAFRRVGDSEVVCARCYCSNPVYHNTYRYTAVECQYPQTALLAINHKSASKGKITPSKSLVSALGDNGCTSVQLITNPKIPAKYVGKLIQMAKFERQLCLHSSTTQRQKEGRSLLIPVPHDSKFNEIQQNCNVEERCSRTAFDLVKYGFEDVHANFLALKVGS
eukprot:Platyproteum_vivax@DN9432_c0_g1_i1.p1